LHLLRREQTEEHPAREEYDRREWMPAGFATWLASDRHALELGYMLTSYEWSQQDAQGAVLSTRQGTTDKVSIAWIFSPSSAFSLKLLLSHEPEIANFGGGNVQVRGAF
jgi:hypothetical protein